MQSVALGATTFLQVSNRMPPNCRPTEMQSFGVSFWGLVRPPGRLERNESNCVMLSSVRVPRLWMIQPRQRRPVAGNRAVLSR
jgi:hypothetical protein